MRTPGWLILILVVYALHQDFWFWRTARPLALGFLPVALTYHALYCFLAAALMWALTRFAWPAHLEHSWSSPAGPPARDANPERRREGGPGSHDHEDARR